MFRDEVVKLGALDLLCACGQHVLNNYEKQEAEK